ncbi:hypothetical protein [Microvirga pudoricolor]|uniref:hypothetical protein n=1 Tax=Microvirga pudoricolor TaxID=2778729 RepID=UPI00194DD27C|nr:hypothetical protein [Microvirga pudoricolor]MBM6593990.1 hypothetical protein [Microvirga pudoricolor]
MIADDVLDKGIARGIISPGQAMALRDISREIDTTLVSEPQDDEKLRFISGFADIFVTIGIGLFSVAVWYLAGTFGGGAGALALAAASWLLAEFFTRRRRQALPSIVLLCLFAGSVFWAGLALGGALFGVEGALSHPNLAFGAEGGEPDGLWILAAALLTAILAALHYVRFRVPITIAVGVAALAGALIFGVVSVAPEFMTAYGSLLIPLVGLAVFALAMRFDMSDPARVTRRTDIAFWLHMLAAPMIVHPIIAKLVIDRSDMTPATAASVLAIFLVLGIVAVVVDRRALLVSGLAYAGYASATIFKTVGLEGQTVPATLLALGAFILLLSAGWRPVRTGLLKLLPANLAQKLPHPILSGP